MQPLHTALFEDAVMAETQFRNPRALVDCFSACVVTEVHAMGCFHNQMQMQSNLPFQNECKQTSLHSRMKVHKNENLLGALYFNWQGIKMSFSLETCFQWVLCV